MHNLIVAQSKDYRRKFSIGRKIWVLELRGQKNLNLIFIFNNISQKAEMKYI